ncbi:MAG TPA: CRISPR-associated helicase Cas3' [Bryobacteraceae bacterium]|nr:CRISPR-associated helicase Cas3' [Bryobacteraceae bacterium]
MSDRLAGLAPTMAHLWAKSEAGPSRELLAHSMDVCRQANEYFRAFQPEWPLPDGARLPRILAYSSLMHDFGKAHVRFQEMLRDDKTRFNNRHEILSLAFLEWLVVPDTEIAWLAAAIATHHRELWGLTGPNGRFRPSDSFGCVGTYAADLAAGADKNDARKLHQILKIAGEVFQETGWTGFPAYEVRDAEDLDIIAGMRAALARIDRLSLALAPRPRMRPGANPGVDWSGVRAAIHTRGWLINADHLASFGSQKIVRSPSEVGALEDRLRESIASRGGQPPKQWPSHQAAARDAEGSAVIEAPTGTGKTEASLLWAARQAEAGARGRTYIMLPYQASMNAMQERLVRDLFPDSIRKPDEWNQHVALVHGRTVRRMFELLARGEIEEESAAEKARLQAELARLNAAPLVICSPYALLRLLFVTKRAEAMLASFWQARIVLDEIHAYEADVTALTLAALRFVEEKLGAKSLVMSATIPSHLSAAIRDSLGPRVRIHPNGDVLDRPSRQRLQLLECDALGDVAAEQIQEKAAAGSVLVVVNQVRRAILLYRRLKDLKMDPILLHSRFNYMDRARIERSIAPRRPGQILIGTQAVEVSLDLDFDCCFSELAPMESLLQRFGRVNRYGLRPPADVFVFARGEEGKARWWLPYAAGHLEQVLAALRSYCQQNPSRLIAERRIPELLDRSYPAQLATSLRDAIVRRSGEVTGTLLASFRAFGARDTTEVSALEQAWEELFDGGEVLPSNLLELARKSTSWTARSRYLVPVSRYALGWLDSRWDAELKCFTTPVTYSSEYGLTPPQ